MREESNMSDLLLDRQLAALVDEHEQLLRQRHPKLAEYLDLMLTPAKLFGGGWLVLGTIYASEDDAVEARRVAVMMKLTEVDRQQS
jgi:hypothetical protein